MFLGVSMRTVLAIAIAICFLPQASFGLSCNNKPIPVAEAKAHAAASELSPFAPMYVASTFGYIGALDWMLTSESQLSESKRRQLGSQQLAVFGLSSLYLVVSHGFSFCSGGPSEEPFSTEDLTSADLNPEETRKAQQRFLIFHSINMVSLGIISFESKNPQKGAALATAFLVPLAVDAINRKFISKRAYSPWALAGGVSESGDPTLVATYEF